MSGAIWENAAGGLIATEVHGVVGLLVSRICAEIKLAWGLEEELEKLKEHFEVLSGILQGISRQPVHNPVMAGWLKKIKDVVEDVDIFLDECSYKALEDKIQTQVTQQWGSVVNTLIRPFDHLDIAHKVSKLEESIADIYKLGDKLGIKLVKVAGGDVYSGKLAQEIAQQDKKLSEQRQCVDLRLFQGRGDDVQKLEDLLCDPTNSNSDLTIIGVVGLAGLGKTTLSKHISRVQRVKNFFDSMVIWLVVSHNFDLTDILKKMFEKVFGEASTMGRQALIDKLEREMKGKKYLIILDDVWDTIEWEFLESILWEIGVSQGTTLLVTSRDQKVIEKWRTTKTPTIYQLKGLSRDDSRILFKKKFQDKIEAGSKEEQIAETMIDRCGGVPLAIRLLADLLRGKKRIEDWREIEQSEIWTKEDEYGILPSLRLSYNYLPHIALKKCFAYCAIFEEDAFIIKQELIYMWMAHGFLQPNDKMERSGEDYIEHLLSCSLFEEAKRDEYGRVVAFKMHDLVWTLARDVSMGECLCLRFKKTNVENNEVRHLSIRRDSACKDLFFESFTKLTTCLLQEVRQISSLNLLWRCKHLRVLILGHLLFENFDWSPLGSLTHLRYLDIAAWNKGCLLHCNLLDQIIKLYHLQTLRIRTFKSHPSEQPFPLKDICNLVNLRHIHMGFYIGIPVGLKHLTALQTLPAINLGLNWGGTRSDMGFLTNLRGKLKIHSLQSLTDGEEARSLGLASKSNLDSLVLNWGYENKENPKENEILEALQPNENLQKLKLCWFDAITFPKWLMGPGSPLNNIVSLHIGWCNFDGNLKVEEFISLRILKVSTCEKLTVTFPNNRSMELLEELHIDWCDKVELLDLSVFPQLRAIAIWYNRSVNRDNVLVGLGSLPNLRKLETDLQVPADLGEESPVCKSLEYLTLLGYENNADKTYLPEQLQHLVALQWLKLRTLHTVEAIPNWLGKLTSLKSLIVERMPKLKHLPPQSVWKSLPNLTSLECGPDCPLLEKDIKNKTGEWFKIAHIPYITEKYDPLRFHYLKTREERLAGDT